MLHPLLEPTRRRPPMRPPRPIDHPLDDDPLLDRPLRAARPADAPALAELLSEAGDGIPYYLWSLRARPGERPLDVGTDSVRDPHSRFSYRNTVVLEREGAVVGALLGFRARSAYRPPRAPHTTPSRPFSALERVMPDAYYVHALAVRRGVPTAPVDGVLLGAAARLGRRAGCERLAVEIFVENRAVLERFTRQGFVVEGSEPTVAHPAHPYTRELLLLSRRCTTDA